MSYLETIQMSNISECESNVTYPSGHLRVISHCLFFGVCFSLINVHGEFHHVGKFSKIFFIALHLQYFLFFLIIKIKNVNVYTVRFFET